MLGAIDQLGGSRTWRRAVKRARSSKYWQRQAGLDPRSYRSPSAWWENQKVGLIDTHALLLTEVGQAVTAVIGAIFPPVGVALAAATVAMTFEEKKILADELVRAELRACAANPTEECQETGEALWFAEYEAGTTMTPGEQEQLSPESAAVLRTFLEDGGDAQQVIAYLAELEKRRTKGKFDAHVAAARV